MGCEAVWDVRQYGMCKLNTSRIVQRLRNKVTDSVRCMLLISIMVMVPNTVMIYYYFS